jgi:hypothetical protein
LQGCVLQPPHDEIVPALVVAESMVNCPRVYSVFHQNLCKALTQITGSTQNFTREAMTTFASFIDAEVVLDCQGSPLPIPSRWGGWSQPRMLLGAAYPEEYNPIIWEAIEQFSSSSKTGLSDVEALEEVCVASDWAARLGTTSAPVARRVAFEADGPRHYATKYPEALLRRLMSHERVSALIRNGAGKHLHLCVQTHFLVKSECPELQGCVLQPPHDEIVPALVVAESMVNCPRVYSVFHQNLCKALTQITGSTQIADIS